MSRRGRAAVALPAGDDHGRSCAVEPGNGRGEETARGDTGGGGLGGDAQTRSEGCGLQRRKTRPGVWIGLGVRSAKKNFGPNQRVVPGLPGLPAGSANGWLHHGEWGHSSSFLTMGFGNSPVLASNSNSVF